MEIKSYSRVGMATEYNIIVFEQADVVIINPKAALSIVPYVMNGVTEFTIKKKEKKQGKIYQLFFIGTHQVTFIDEEDKQKIEKVL